MIENKNIPRRNFLQLASASTGALLLSGCSGSSADSNSGKGININNSNSSYCQTLRFNKNHKFKIIQFTDIHWLDGTEDDVKTDKLMHDIIQFEKPELIVLTGDIISGKDADSAYAQRDILTRLSSNKIPWSIVFGNHDDEGSCSRRQLWQIAASIPYNCCPPKVPDISGVSNYVLDICSADSDNASYILFMIDSNGYSTEKDFEDYGWIMPDQIEWFRNSSDKNINPKTGKPLPALAFFHIPIPEYDFVVEKKKYIGEFNEDVCCPELNSGFFAAALEKNNIMGMFVGHDHVNDFEAKLANIKLCYGRKTGFRSYSQDGFAKGARIIELTEGNIDFDTWLTVEGCKQIKYQS